MDYEKMKKEYAYFNKHFPEQAIAMPSQTLFNSRDVSRKDMVNSPAHYTRGKQECIDIIEDVIKDAPDPVTGSLHSHVLKYVLRLWLKDNPKQDAEKSVWYLKRLIKKLEELD